MPSKLILPGICLHSLLLLLSFTSHRDDKDCSCDLLLADASFVVCNTDGTCSEDDTPNGVTCCKVCKSCTYKNCCHCNFIKPDKYCPIKGWRAPDYTGDKNAPKPNPLTPRSPDADIDDFKKCLTTVPRTVGPCPHKENATLFDQIEVYESERTLLKRSPPNFNRGNCADPFQLWIAMLAFAYTLLTHFEQVRNPAPGAPARVHDYRMVNWAGPGGVMPSATGEGFVIMRTREDGGGIPPTERVEFVDRILTPADRRHRPDDGTADFSETFRNTYAELLNARRGPQLNILDQAGHLIAATVGGPANHYNFAWMHPDVNQGGPWAATEDSMRQWLDGDNPHQSANRQVRIRIYLIYDPNNWGRPIEFVWSVVFFQGNNIAWGLEGRVQNEATPVGELKECTFPGPNPGPGGNGVG